MDPRHQFRDAALLLGTPPAPPAPSPLPTTLGRAPFIDQLCGIGLTYDQAIPGTSDLTGFGPRLSPSDLHGVGLHGGCAGGVCAIVIPKDKVSAQTWLTSFASVRTLSAAFFGNGMGGEPLGIPEGVYLLRPGDVVHFSEPLHNGAFIWLFYPFQHCGSVSIPWTTQFTPRPSQQPLVRWFLQPPGPATSRLQYAAIPAVYFATSFASASPPANNSDVAELTGVRLGPYIKTVAIQFADNTALGGTRVVPGESNSFEVWWKLNSGLWAHHEDDDFDATGRGNASDKHDTEVYSVPMNAIAVALFPTGGGGSNSFYYYVYAEE